ncbi:MAG: 4'-phosphopantetheinyl transferase superfamily protein [Rhodobacteraceae bacterium]|nr:4'-phosphopantetheinyl transferase superfamily protein [Paracoccaceae bacterium]
MSGSIGDFHTAETNEVTWIRHYCQIRDVLVIHIDLIADGDCEDKALFWLDQKERERLGRYRFDRPRREFVLSRSAMRQILCCFLKCRNEQLSFETNAHGKPIPLVDGSLANASVNLTHSGNHGLVGIAPEGQLGIDLEVPVERSNVEGIGQMVFTDDEQSELASATGKEKLNLFYRLWTLKEALIKALGTGFSLNPNQFEIPQGMRQGASRGKFRFPHMPDIQWELDFIGNRDFVASLAYAREITQP